MNCSLFSPIEPTFKELCERRARMRLSLAEQRAKYTATALEKAMLDRKKAVAELVAARRELTKATRLNR